ncbi:E3 ubiquitin-protein ligase RNF216-like [Palaemon carinicauda]|uniref:E3 ubiquitin-protein ligase RNF216-like n=1 Tax=Palaemon carinicauda TaxID=392227 RepID=UPI0035B6372C
MEGVIEDWERWYSEKVDFVSCVVRNVDKSFIRNHVLQCENNKDVEILIQYLLENEDSDREKRSKDGIDAAGGEIYYPSTYDFTDEVTPNGHRQASVPHNSGHQNQGAIRKERFGGSNEGNARPKEETEGDVEARVMAQVVSLAEMFMDADPEYLQKICWEIRGNKDRFLSVVQKMLRDPDYPKMESYLQRQREREIQRTFESLSVEEYLAFVGEMHEEELETGKDQCLICYSDVPICDMVSCSARRQRHRYCGDCTKRFAEEEIGQGRFTFRCPEIECPGSIDERDLRSLLAPAVMDRVMQKQQEYEIERAGIEDLESCPFCEFKVIMPNKHDKVFVCQNPACLKDSCRLCKEMNHIPKTCREVLAEKQKDVRVTLENRMAEAMIRQCVRCKKRFIIEAGCNKMTCPCGAIMCYLCKQPIQGYDHFTQHPEREPNKCPLWSNSTNVHGQEVRQAARQAKQELAADEDLVHDPTRDLDNI